MFLLKKRSYFLFTNKSRLMIRRLLVVLTAVFLCTIGISQTISDYCAEEVTHFGGDPPSAIFLTIANVDATSMIVEIESATADPVDFLLVNGGSGAVISDEDFSVPGKISRTLTWTTPPADVVLNILWSTASFGGNWQLSQGDITVPFDAICTFAPTSDYCEEEVTHFGGDPGSAIFLTIANVDATSMIVEIESATADPVDLLLIPAFSGVTISDEDFSVPGKISRTLTWTTPPTNVSLNVLWSTESFGGNWQLSQGDIMVPFAAFCPVIPPTPMSDYCETETLHFGGDLNSAILLTIANVDDFTMVVEIESADADPVDFLLIPDASGGAISAENTSVPGKISRTITWTAPPTNVSLNILWSKASFGGNWQLSQANIMVPFAATCPIEPPPPPANPEFCATETLHFGGDPGSAILLTIANLDANSMFVEIQSADADAVDFLLVLNGSGATISDELTPVPGTIIRTLTWATPPTEVDINILWSKESFGGNWQLSQGDVTVDFDFTCNSSSIPTMGEWSLFYLALLIVIIGVVYIPVFQNKLQLSTTGGTAPSPMHFSLSYFPFERKEFFNALKTTGFLVPIGFAIIYLLWGGIILDDLVGMALAVPLVAYLIYLLKRDN